MANRVDLNQTLCSVSHIGLHCKPMGCLSKYLKVKHDILLNEYEDNVAKTDGTGTHPGR